MAEHAAPAFAYEGLDPYGCGHPDPQIAFEIEADILHGMAYDVRTGFVVSQWPFWGRLSQALRHGRENAWFERPDLEPFLRGLDPYARGKADGVGLAKIEGK